VPIEWRADELGVPAFRRKLRQRRVERAAQDFRPVVAQFYRVRELP